MIKFFTQSFDNYSTSFISISIVIRYSLMFYNRQVGIKKKKKLYIYRTWNCEEFLKTIYHRYHCLPEKKGFSFDVCIYRKKTCTFIYASRQFHLFFFFLLYIYRFISINLKRKTSLWSSFEMILYYVEIM